MLGVALLLGPGDGAADLIAACTEGTTALDAETEGDGANALLEIANGADADTGPGDLKEIGKGTDDDSTEVDEGNGRLLAAGCETDDEVAERAGAAAELVRAVFWGVDTMTEDGEDDTAEDGTTAVEVAGAILAALPLAATVELLSSTIRLSAAARSSRPSLRSRARARRPGVESVAAMVSFLLGLIDRRAYTPLQKPRTRAFKRRAMRWQEKA